MTKRHGVFFLILVWLMLIPGLNPAAARAAGPAPQDRLMLLENQNYLRSKAPLSF